MTAADLLAINVRNLYLLVMLAGESPALSQLRAELLNPRPGDWVLDTSYESFTKESVGRLSQVFEDGTCLVYLASGQYLRWREPRLIKIPNRLLCLGELEILAANLAAQI